ncbi:MAG TPA: hypothetical protein PKZ36_01600 [Candidatus Paceibacterota bacterium]|nr:hypothetical protein [Candidatus Paceibacterota bacterium]HPT18082.1 hypothetical protein [Candidatus Paceibacterota bacterium]
METTKTEDGRMKIDWLVLSLLSCCLIATAVSFYFFFHKKAYDFIIEIPCDPNKEVCSFRDCSEPDSCPPNNFSFFKKYNLRASDFNKCPDGDCSVVCETGQINCEPIECVADQEIGEVCTSPLPIGD